MVGQHKLIRIFDIFVYEESRVSDVQAFFGSSIFLLNENIQSVVLECLCVN